MKYRRFEDVPVWQRAIELGRRVYRFTSMPVFKGQFSLRDQLERAAVSVSNNIAEGFERGTTNELVAFLYYARGSASEVRSMLCLIEGIEWLAPHHQEITQLKEIAESCSRQLHAWADSLQNSEIRGQRHFNDATRKKAEQQQAAKDARERQQNTLPPTDSSPHSPK